MFIEIIKHNIISVGSITLGLVLGQIEPNGIFSDPVSVSIIKDYISIFVALGGFVLLLINTIHTLCKKSK